MAECYLSHPIIMDFLYPASLLISVLLISVLLLLFKRTATSHRPPEARLPIKMPPGPWQLPIIGSIHHLFGSVPHRRLSDLSRIYGPIMHLKLGEISTMVASSPEAAREFMKTHDVTFASRPQLTAPKIVSFGGQSMVFCPNGEFWKQLRKICVLELLSAKRVQSFQSVREEEVLNLIRSISSSRAPVVNLSKMLGFLTNDIITMTVIGNTNKDQATFVSALNEAVELTGGFDLADLFPSWSRLLSLISAGRYLRLKRCHQTMDRLLNGIIQEHKERRAALTGAGLGRGHVDEDLLDVLLRVQEEGNLPFSLTTDHIKTVVLELFAAGTETTATTLAWAMTELVRNPRVMKKSQSEIRGARGGKEAGKPITGADVGGLQYLKLVIQETLRLHPPAPLLLPRECQETCEVLGYEIPAKARVVVNAWAIGRDPRHWGDDSEEFRPERFEGSDINFKGSNFEYIPFGSGRRMCPGMSFGLTSMELPLAQLLYYFDWELPGGAHPDDLDMGETFGATAKRTSDLCLRAIPRITFHTA